MLKDTLYFKNDVEKKKSPAYCSNWDKSATKCSLLITTHWAFVFPGEDECPIFEIKTWSPYLTHYLTCV